MSNHFMQFYPGDYLRDTRGLSTTQHGAYLLLLMSLWCADGHLPNDDAVLARVTGTTRRGWLNIKPAIMPLLTIDGDQITQSRLLVELQKSTAKSEKRRCFGKRGGDAKALKDKEACLAKATVLPWHLPEPEPEPERSSKKVVVAASPLPPPKASRKVTSTIPENFPTAEGLLAACAYWAERDRGDLVAADEARAFTAHHKSHGSRMADWGQAWVTWYSKAIKFNRKPNNGKPTTHNNFALGAYLAAGD